jgi:hypothetical protein
MLLTAQHVHRSAEQDGINAFCSLHGPYTWYGPPPAGIPEQNPGQRVHERVAIPAGGNRVRSYLDIVAPDETPTSEILSAIPTFVANMRSQALPWVDTVGRCTFRFEVEPALRDLWATELEALLGAALRVRVPL